MALPPPEPGLVVQFNYLWRRERDEGWREARYPRPVAIVLVQWRREDGAPLVLLAPITHSQPKPGDGVVEIPPKVKAHLGLDQARSWIITDELNETVWPGFDLVPIAEGRWAYGFLPPRLYELVRQGVLEAARAGRLGRVAR